MNYFIPGFFIRKSNSSFKSIVVVLSACILLLLIILVNISITAAISLEAFLRPFRKKQFICRVQQQLLVCSLLNENAKEGCNSPPPGNLSQPPSPRPTRPLSSYSSPVATGFPSYELQSLQLPAYSFAPLTPACHKDNKFGQAVTPDPQ